MNRLLRCNGVGRRLFGTGFVCLLLSASFWLRCDDSKTSSRHAPLSLSQAHSRVSVYAVGGESQALKSRYLDRSYGDPDFEPLPMAADTEAWHPQRRRDFASSGNSSSRGYYELECLVNDESSISCRRDSWTGEVYVPFSFVSKYFEIYGKMASDGTKFLWHHSYSRVYPVDQQYSPYGVFMSFEHYNVELRERVKCISGIEGVPVSTQWSPLGYFYATQIAQYGLSHYSKFLRRGVKGRASSTTLEDAEDESVSRWTVNGHGRVRNVLDDLRMSHVIEFHTSDRFSEEPEVFMVLSNTSSGSSINAKFYLSLDLFFTINGTLTVVVITDRRQLYKIHYVCSNSMLSASGNDSIFYGIGTARTGTWSTVGRDIAVDLQKGIAQLAFQISGRKRRSTKVAVQRIVRIELRGAGRVDNVSLAKDSHLSKFFDAANWLVRNQDSRGGWPIPVGRSLADGQLTLSPGWYSAMAQGQAMSLLVRAYGRTRNREYLDSAFRGLSLFRVLSSDGGVAARFMDKYTWYEEYPTSPPCFVLNGFIYALVGLYDVASVGAGQDHDDARTLFSDGLSSLHALLPLFDTGSGTIYDLRHLALGGNSAPNRARWDYHTTHINQLLLLASLLRQSDDERQRSMAVDFDAVVKRWTGYMKGQQTPHN